MAVANIKAPRKAKSKPRSTKALDMAHVGHLPDWKTVETCESENFYVALNDALRHYGYFYSVKDLKPKVVDWMVDREYDKTAIKAFKKSLDHRTPMTAGSLAAAYAAGMPLYPRAEEFLTDAVATAISYGDEGTDEEEVDPTAQKKKAKAPSIQDRITAKVNEHILFIEESWEDGIIERKEKHPTPDILSYLRTEGVPPSMVTRIVDHFTAQLNEIVESQSKTGDEQLIEAYAHLKKADVKRFTDFYKSLIADLEMYRDEKKATAAPRKRKSVSKAISDGFTTLGVKGTTITGFDATNSVQKTLRKPAEQLAEFKKAGKVKLRTFMEDVKAVEIKLTGRINKDTILLKVVK
jgi:hypothetical protein